MKKIFNYFRSVISSSDVWTLFFVLMVLLYILPIWVFKYFPSQDGPCHTYNSFIIRHYNDPDYVFNEYYNIRKAPIPNWMSHASMALFMYLVPPLIAEKMLLTGYIILMAGGMLYMLNVVERGRTPLAFLGFPFIYYHLLLIGFYNYSLSIGFLMLSIGYWWKHFDDFNIKNTIVLTLLLTALYFCHPVGIVLGMFSIGVIAIFRLLPKFTKWKQALLGFLSTLPSIALMIYYLRTRGTGHGGSWKLSRLWQYFIRNEELAYYSQSQLILAKFVTGAFVIFFFYTLIRDHFFTRDWHFGFRIRKKDFFFLLCAGFFLIYIFAPTGMSGGWVIKERLSFLPFLIIIPWLSWDMPKIARGIAGSAIMILAAVYLIHASYYHKKLSEQVEIYVSGCDVVERNKVIMPMSFGAGAGAWRVGVVFHAAGYYGYKRGSIEVFNYEAGLVNYFPTYYKSGWNRPPSGLEGNPNGVDIGQYAEDIDYIITWNLPVEGEVETRILGNYKQIKHNKSLKVFEQREWKGEPIEPVRDKTLVAWVYNHDLEQQGSGILTLEKFNIFDSIVFGEIRPRTWMPGSNGLSRTHQDQSSWHVETADKNELVKIAIVYKGNEVILYRNDQQYASYTIDQPFTFSSGMKVLMGLRHQQRAGSENSHFAGAIEEARIYDRALEPTAVKSLEVNQPSEIEPLAVWTFEDGTAKDEMGFFQDGKLFGDAAIQDGKLILDGKGDYMATPPKFGNFRKN